MARIRDPARDKAKELYLNNKDITNREIANILGIDEKKVATWKYRDKWECNTEEKKNVVQQNKKCSTTKPKEEKKELVSNEDKGYEWVDEEDGLTDKQRLFCHYYMQSLNAFQAAIKAEYSPSYARVDVYRLLENPSIKKYLGKLKEQQKQDFLISQEKILNRHVQVAFSDINEYFEENGSLKPLSETDGSLIKKLKITETEERRTVEIELIEKCKSLDALTKWVGLDPVYQDKNKSKNETPVFKGSDDLED
ncbi:terminase small subunit [Fusobacterium ulcerans]|uniref:terminase small subunit n=1 Tax=Fusobacterium ulcerans TaxID=861 RepID=UPI0010304C95|nr:terminase small subunit [Fusobacterium ulcerans]